jgi:hypothetical protein
MLMLTILTAAVGFPLSFILISQFGVIGLIVTSLTYGIPSLVVSLRFIKKQFGVSVDWVSSTKILLSSGVAGLLTYFLISLMTFSSPIRLIIGVIIFSIVCIFAMLVGRTLNKADLNNLEEIINALGPLRKPLRFLLKLIEKLMTILRLDNKLNNI